MTRRIVKEALSSLPELTIPTNLVSIVASLGSIALISWRSGVVFS